MKKARFLIVGSGWRSLFYVRIAKALPEHFEVCAMLCRTEEKAEKMAKEHGIVTETSIQKCRDMKPDFVVVAVNKASIPEVSVEWMNYGFTVFCETPASLDREMLQNIWQLHQAGKKLVVAEQYTSYPLYGAMLQVLEQDRIGEPYNINLSVAHEYHGTSMIRAFLREKTNTPFKVTGKNYLFDTVETVSRYEKITDGRQSPKSRVVATFEFEDGKVAWYDFNSEQYRSPIRKNYIKVQGCKGELKDKTLYYLDENYEGQQAELVVTERWMDAGADNPNPCQICEVEKIVLRGEALPEQLLYESPFGRCGLIEDEIAMAILMKGAAEYNESEDECVRKRQEERLKNALQDSYMTILLQEAVADGTTKYSEPQVWQ